MLPRNVLPSSTARGHLRSTTREFSCADQSSHHQTGVDGNCGSSEHSLRWYPAPFTNTFSLLNPEFATHDADGSKFEIWKDRMRRWRRRGSTRRSQGNGRRLTPDNGNSQHNSRGPPPHQQGNSSGLSHATGVAAAPTHPPTPSSAHGPDLASTAPTMRYGPASSGHTNPNARHPGTFQVQPSPTP